MSTRKKASRKNSKTIHKKKKGFPLAFSGQTLYNINDDLKTGYFSRIGGKNELYKCRSRSKKKWGLLLRRVQDICKLGKVPGAKHLGKNWLIPEDAEKPADGRRKEVKENLHHYRPLIRKTPFLTMTNLYTVPGSAEEVTKALEEHPEGQALFNAQIAYARGDIDTVYNYAKYFLELHTGFYAVISGGMLLASALYGRVT